LDGFQAAAQIRELERGRAGAAKGSARLPIIALTANAIEGDRQRCLEAGMDGYLTKPVDPDALIETLRALLPLPRATTASNAAVNAGASSQPQPKTKSASPSKEGADTGGEPIDADSLLRRCRGKASLAERLLAQFEQQLGEQIHALGESLERRDREVLARVAHTVKGAAANMSATRVCDAAAELERLGTAADFEAAAASLEALAEQVRQCRAFVPAAIDQVRQLDRKTSGASELA
jgi:HPt (histidine-containing phosphotransfer) domain-containing protein